MTNAHPRNIIALAIPTAEPWSETIGNHSSTICMTMRGSRRWKFVSAPNHNA
jgi:hypothetical protein